MSRSYWGIVGYGIDTDNLIEYLDYEKIITLIHEICPETKNTIKTKDDVDDMFYGDIYNDIAEFLCEIDDTKKLTWETRGDLGGSYFYYSQELPWVSPPKRNDPRTREDADNLIYNVLEKISKDDCNIRECVHCDYICDAGCG